jgi:hypothetical protein
MNNSFARLIEGMCHQLQHEVLPRVTDDYARSQLWGVINALNTFAVRADWSSPLLLQQIAAQQQALTAVATLLPGVGVPASPGDVPSTAGLMALREQGNRAIADRRAGAGRCGAGRGTAAHRDACRGRAGAEALAAAAVRADVGGSGRLRGG